MSTVAVRNTLAVRRHHHHEAVPSTQTPLHTSDYIYFDSDFDSILDLIAIASRQDQEKQESGTPKSVIDSLPVVKATDPSLKSNSCPICQDEFERGSGSGSDSDSEKINQLPCKHLFHHGCIVPWLYRSSTCPMCRCTLAADCGPTPPSPRLARQYSSPSSTPTRTGRSERATAGPSSPVFVTPSYPPRARQQGRRIWPSASSSRLVFVTQPYPRARQYSSPSSTPTRTGRSERDTGGPALSSSSTAFVTPPTPYPRASWRQSSSSPTPTPTQPGRSERDTGGPAPAPASSSSTSTANIVFGEVTAASRLWGFCTAPWGLSYGFGLPYGSSATTMLGATAAALDEDGDTVMLHA